MDFILPRIAMFVKTAMNLVSCHWLNLAFYQIVYQVAFIAPQIQGGGRLLMTQVSSLSSFSFSHPLNHSTLTLARNHSMQANWQPVNFVGLNCASFEWSILYNPFAKSVEAHFSRSMAVETSWLNDTLSL